MISWAVAYLLSKFKTLEIDLSIFVITGMLDTAIVGIIIYIEYLVRRK